MSRTQQPDPRGTRAAKATVTVPPALSVVCSLPEPAQLARVRARLFLKTRASGSVPSVPWRINEAICGTIPLELAMPALQAYPSFLAWDGNTVSLSVAPGHTQEATAQLTVLARWIHQLGQSPDPDLAAWARPWRGESLDVRAEPDGPALASIDRSAVRALGVLTQSVRLNAWLADGRLLLAKRAKNKRIDPGLWDNLTGGLMVAGEDPVTALLRETAEEAGLDLRQDWAQQGLGQPAAAMSVDRPIPDGRLRERLHAFDLQLPTGTVCCNQDGEVDCFALFTPVEALQAIDAGQVSIEAALAILDSISRRMPA